MKLLSFILVVMTLFSREVLAGDEKFFPVLGASTATRSSAPARGSFDLGLFYGRRSDAIIGGGVVMSIPTEVDGELYIGPAFGLFYMGTIWLEAAAHMKKGDLVRVRATAAGGLFLMPFVSLGYDKPCECPMAEFGLMLKVPFFGS